jgi:hypothetical protein
VVLVLLPSRYAANVTAKFCEKPITVWDRNDVAAPNCCDRYIGFYLDAQET